MRRIFVQFLNMPSRLYSVFKPKIKNAFNGIFDNKERGKIMKSFLTLLTAIAFISGTTAAYAEGTVHLYASKSAALKHCPAQPVVLVNLTSGVFHAAESPTAAKGLKNGKWGCLAEVITNPEFKPAANNN